MKRILACLLFLASLQVAFSQITTNGLVASYPFNGNPRDESGNDHHGVMVGNPVLTSDRFGTANSAYLLNGASAYIALPSAIAIPRDLSISFWMKTTSSDPNGWTSGTFVIDRDLCNSQRDWSVCMGLGGKIQFITGAGSDHVLTSTHDINDGTWRHVVVVRDGGSLKKSIYVDGVLSASDSFDDVAFGNAAADIHVGSSFCLTSTHTYYTGAIDDICFYDRPLTASEIMALYLDGTSNSPNTTLSLDGIGDYVLLNTGPVLSTLPQHTIELWFKWEGIKNPQFPVQGRDMGQAIYTENREGGATYRIVINGDSTIEFLFDHAYVGYTAVTSITKIVMNRWYHVAGTFDVSSGKKIYINGVLEDTDPDTRLPSDGSSLPSNEVFLGKDNLGGGSLADFCGRIDEVRAWNEVRSANDIAANMCNPVPSWERSKLVGYWRMEGSYADSSSAGLHGLPRNDAKLVKDVICEEILVLHPNGGESFQIGEITNITWQAPTAQSVDLAFSTDGGTNWSSIATALPSGTGSHSWTVPATPSTQCLVRVQSSSDPSLLDASDAVFTIQPSQETVQIIRPNGGEMFTVGDVESIEWSGTITGSIDLYFSTNNGTSWNQIATGLASSAGSYSWSIPNAPSDQCLVRIRSVDDPTVQDVSDAVFSIQAPAGNILVVRPNGGEQLNAGTIYSIQWHAPSSAMIRLEYSTDAGNSWLIVATGLNATNGSYDWNVPNTPSTQCLMRITDESDPLLTDISDGYFEIRMFRELRLIRPNGGEVWYVGDTNRISWSASGITRVNIEYSTDDGASWSIVFLDAEASATRHDWVIPDTPSKRCRVRIAATAGMPLQDGSNAMFEIARRPQLSLLTPDGGERWMVGSVENIRWTASSVDFINLDFSPDAGVTWTRILDRFAAFRQSWTWKIPPTISQTCLVRITDADGRVADESAAFFEIYDAPLRVVTPNGGEVWDIGMPRYITWSSRGVQRIRIDYSHDRGKSWINVARNVPAADAKYDWAVPDTPSDTCYVLLRDEDNTSISDISDHVFEIRQPPAVEVLTPNGGEVWRVGTTHLITWNAFKVADVRIEYSQDDGASWTEIAGPVPAEKRSHDWRIPNHHSAFCIIRISGYSDPTVFDVSNAHFDIVPNKSVTLTSPTGGEQLIAGSTSSITWTSINVANILLEYSSNNGSTWTEIDPRVPSTGIYAWSVPLALTMQGRIRITDVDDELVFDTSPANFQIQTSTGIAPSPTPEVILLEQNYPNPFNPSTRIRFVLENPAEVRLSVHDLFGRELRRLLDGHVAAGLHHAEFDALSLPAGVYVCRLVVGDAVRIRYMTLLK